MEARILILRTAEEWANENLPGLRRGKRGLNKYFSSIKDKGCSRNGRGGGFVYPLSALPAVAQKAYLDRLASEIAAKKSAEKTEVALQLPTNESTSHLKTWQRRTVDARLAVLSLVEELSLLVGVNAAVAKVVEQARDGSLPAPIAQLVPLANARGGKTGKRTLSRRTLFNWLAAKREGLAELAPELPPNADRTPPWAVELLAEYRQPQKPSVGEAVRMLNERGIRVSYDAARRFLKQKVSTLELEKGRLGPRETRTRFGCSSAAT